MHYHLLIGQQGYCDLTLYFSFVLIYLGFFFFHKIDKSHVAVIKLFIARNYLLQKPILLAWLLQQHTNDVDLNLLKSTLISTVGHIHLILDDLISKQMI